MQPRAPRFSPPPVAQAQQGPVWVGVAVRFAGDEQSPKGRWLTFEYGPGAHIEVQHRRDDYGGIYDFAMPVRTFSPSTASVTVTVSGWPAPVSTWPDWFPDAPHKRDADAVAAASVSSPARAPRKTTDMLIGGDLVAGGERERKGGWL